MNNPKFSIYKAIDKLDNMESVFIVNETTGSVAVKDYLGDNDPCLNKTSEQLVSYVYSKPSRINDAIDKELIKQL